ncbi:MAG: NUDIX domain-containing protein [Thioalkalivibrio sp.]|nr:NUDIX domain-containing protein [Thioalkalivibrio sp.]
MSEAPSRDWAVATFVVWRGAVMLHRHAKLGLWLPCGGHVEPDELPDDAAVREVLEESGVRVRLVGVPPVVSHDPRALVPPRGVQLSRIADGHEHVDLIYLALPETGYTGELIDDPTLGWYGPDDLARLPLSDEIRAWSTVALAELGGAVGAA